MSRSRTETRVALFRLARDQQGRRWTREFELAARVIFDLPPPVDRELVIPEILRRYGARVSRSTVHRVLRDLERAGLL